MVRRTSLILSEIIAGLLAGMVALGGLVAWRLHAGPVPLDFLTPHLEEALKTEGRGYTVDIDETVAVWAGWRNAVDIVATNVVVTAPDGSTLARVPQLSLGLSLRALVRGNVAPTSLDAIGPNVRVIRQENGEFALGFVEVVDEQQPMAVDGPPIAKPAAGTEVIDFLVDELLADPDPSRSFGYLRRISILGGQVVFEDRVAGSYFRSPDAEIVLLKGSSGITGDAKLKLQYGDRQADFTISAGINKDDLGYFAALNFNDVEPAAFATSLPPQLSAITALSMPLNGSVNLHGKLKGELESFDFDLLGAAGKLELTDLYREPLNVSSLRVQGSATADFSTVRIEQAIIDLGDATAFAEAALEPVEEGGGVRVSLSAHMEEFEIRELHRFWPVSAQPGARKWVTENIYEGIVDRGTIDLALTIGDGGDGGVTLEKLEGTLAYTDLGISYFKEMTPVVGVNGAGTFDRHGFYLGVGEASLAEDIKVTGGQVEVVDMDQKGKARLVIDVKTEGPIVTALKVLDEDPLHYGDKLGFDPADLGGVSSADLHFELTLIKGLTGDMLDVTAKGKLTGVSAPNGPFDLAISEGALDLEVTRADMLLAGDVRLNGVPAEIAWKENFDAGAKFKRRFEVKASPDDAQRLALNLPDLSYWIKGTAPTELTYTVVAKREPKLVVRSDLTPTLFRIPEAAWQKDPGKPGRLEIDARVLKAGNLIFDRLNVKTGDAEGTVKIEFLPDMSDIAKVTLRDLRYRGNDVKGEITLMDNGGYRVDIEGDRVDVRHFLTDEYEKIIMEAEGGDGKADKKGKPLTIKANFKEAVTGEGRRMHRGTFNGAYNGRDWEQVILIATLGEGAELKVNYGKGEKGYELLVESDDAGQALRSLGWWDEIQGGSMAIEGRRETVDAPLTGNLWVKDFRMKEAPAGIKLLQIITLVGLPAAAAAGEGVSFAGLEGSYTYDGGLLTFGEMEAWGPVGVHVDKGGWMNFNENSIEMQGVVVPANTLQQLFGIIPLFGLFFQEGLIAANFEVSGKLDEPKVEGKPGSVLALGFLRKLFRLKPQEDSDQPGNKPGAEPPTQRD
ncbi:MAG: hypothetical protein KAR37_04155 [Alphaproteobacteria bacterium]|nr:hypothetical protein [Alphaproteobacteria bacterium]